MRNLKKVADYCWDGLTLKYVSHKGIVIPYVLLLVVGILLEIFLFVLLIVSAFLFYSYGYRPNLQYFVCSGILTILLMYTVPVLFTIINRKKPR